MDLREFMDEVINLSRRRGHTIETNRNGQRQVDFGHKKLHEGHLTMMFPRILDNEARVSTIIEEVAPGRPCTHKPMREIIQAIRSSELQ